MALCRAAKPTSLVGIDQCFRALAATLCRIRPALFVKLELPTLAIFTAFVAEMRRVHSRDSKNCADLTEGLAYTGIRCHASPS